MRNGLTVIVCGGRDFWKPEVVNATLSALQAARGPFYAVIHGNAAGADRLGGIWARQNNVREWPVPAEWRKHGHAAGPIRNKNMLGMSPDLVVAFPGGKGTRNMVKQARAAAVEVIEVPR